MSGIEGLKAGQRAAVKTAEAGPIPAVQGEIASVDRGQVRFRVSAASLEKVREIGPASHCVMTWDDRGRTEEAPVRVISCEGDDLVILPDALSAQREAVRVRTTAVFTYEVIPAQRVEAAAAEIRNAASDFVEDAFHVDRLWHSGEDLAEKLDEEFGRLAYQVAELNSKVDYLIALAEGRLPEQSVRRYREIQNFSGGGMGFNENKALAAGAILRMAIELSRFPRQVVHCLGEVVRCEPRIEPGAIHACEFSIGVRFTVIHEDDRERIIRHVFRMQRRYLRDRKERTTEI